MRVKRTKLIKVEKVSIISNGYGNLLGRFKVGQIVGNNSRSVQMSFRDDDGTYVENYTLLDGIRVDDIGCDDGWRVNPAEWSVSAEGFLPTKSTDKGIDGKSRMLLVDRADHSLEDLDGNTNKLVVEVWQDSITKSRYMRAVRETHNPETKRIKQVPAIVPFSIMIKVLADFESEWIE